MSDDPIDLSSLDPQRDRPHFEQLMQRLHQAAAPELERRALGQSIWWQLFEWRKAFLTAASAALMILAGTAYLMVEPFPAGEARTDDLAQALGVPTEVISWSVSDSLPTTAQVFFPSEEN